MCERAMLWQFTKVERERESQGVASEIAHGFHLSSFQFACCSCKEESSVQSFANNVVYSRAGNDNNLLHQILFKTLRIFQSKNNIEY